MAGLADIFGVYARQLAREKFGSDWEEKNALLRAQTAQTQAQIPKAAAETARIGAETDQTIAQTARVPGQMALDEASLARAQEELKMLQQDRDEKKALVDAGQLPASDLRAAELILSQKDADLNRRLKESQIGENNAQAWRARNLPLDGGGNPNTGQWVQGPDGKMYMLTKNGLVNTVNGMEITQPPTADQRNAERYDKTLPVHLDNLQVALDDLKGLGWSGGMAGMVPGTDSHRKVVQYTRLVNALAVTAGKAMGEGRLTDQDRAVYAGILGVANKLAGLPPGSELAQKLLDNARRLLTGEPTSDLPGGGWNQERADLAAPQETTDLPGGGWNQGAADTTVPGAQEEVWERDASGRLVRVR